YRLYRMRWAILLTIMLLNIANSMIWITYSAIAQTGSSYFQMSLTATNMLNLVFYICYLVSSVPSAFVIDRHGIRAALACGAVGTVLGAWLRYLAVVIPMAPHASYAVTMVGHILAGLSQPFILNLPTKFAATWFPEDGRAIANMVSTASNPIGIALGSVLVPALAPNADGLPTMLVVIAAIATVAALPIFWVRATPPTPACPPPPPSEHSFLQGVRVALSMPGFWALVILFGGMVGVFSALTGLLNNIVIPYGYSEDDAGIFGAVTILAGLVGAAIVSVFIDKTAKHKPTVRATLPFTMATFIGLIFAVRSDSFEVIIVLMAMVGLFCFSLLPVGLELSVECTYPVPEASSTGLLWMAGQAIALVTQLVMNVLRDDEGADHGQDPLLPPGNMRNALILLAAL
ncbi:major facilitator superfamily domain-containing protein, partial [Thamnocephalis sphaerospora]